jgi:hypothetical protein
VMLTMSPGSVLVRDSGVASVVLGGLGGGVPPSSCCVVVAGLV